MADQKSVQNEGIVSDDAIQAWLSGEIHRFLHVERTMSREQLAQAANIKLSMLDALRKTGEGRRPLRPGIALSLCCVMGERRVNGLLAMIGYSGARQIGDACESNVRDLVSNILPDLAVLGEAARDGTIDHVEEVLTTPAADRIIKQLIPLSSLGNH